jgi:hypothetical protein
MKNTNSKSQNQPPRPIRALDADALRSVQGGFHFVIKVNKPSPG